MFLIKLHFTKNNPSFQNWCCTMELCFRGKYRNIQANPLLAYKQLVHSHPAMQNSVGGPILLENNMTLLC